MKHKKGFTLMELLAVIVILAVIALIAIPLIMNVINDVKKGAMEQNKRTMERAGELFIWDKDNKGRRPKMDGDRTYIQLEELENEYMKKIQGNCEGYVAVDNESGEYYYTAYLDCGNGNALYVDSEYVNYGGKYIDEFSDAIKTKDGGFITVGSSNSPNYGSKSNHSSDVKTDAIIVKYNKEGKIEWENNFGGSNNDSFESVIEVHDGYLIVGTSFSKDGDLNDLKVKNSNVILIKYNKKGKLIDKRIISAATESSGYDLIAFDEKIYVIGDSRENSNHSNLAMLVCLNQKLEIEWKKFYGGTYRSVFQTLTLTRNGNLILGGYSLSTDGDMADIKIGQKGIQNAILFEINPNNGNIISKYAYNQFTNFISDILVYDDCYIISDGFKIIKIDSNTGKIIKSFSSQSINSLQRVEDGVLFTNYGENSNKKQQIKISLLDTNLEVIKEKSYQTTEYTTINRVVEENGEYYAFGMSFSLSDIFETFNYGNSDAIMMKLDGNLNLKEDFKIQTLLKQKMPELVKNYGTKIPTPEDRENLKIYTTNDTMKEIGTWCSNNRNYLDPNANYKYPMCLNSFNHLNNISIGYQEIYQGHGDNPVVVSTNVKNSNNWLRIKLDYGNSGTGNELSNLKVKFTGTEGVTIEKAVELDYVEPLVISGFLSSSNLYFFENSYNLLSGKSTGMGNYLLHIFI